MKYLFLILLCAGLIATFWWTAQGPPPIQRGERPDGGVAAGGPPAPPPAIHAPERDDLPEAGEARPLSLAEDIARRMAEQAAEHQDPVEREAFLQSAVQGVPRALYGQMAELLGNAPAGSVDSELLRAILLRWAWEEPTNVAGWAVDHPGHAYRREALALAAQSWARRDPAQLLEWSVGLPAADRQWVVLRSGDYLGRTDPALFAVWRQAIQPGRERDQLELTLAREWAQRDPSELAAELVLHSAPEYEGWRQLTLAGLAHHLGTMSGPAAAQFVTERLPAGPLQEGAVMGAVVAWAREDPSAARSWIETLPSLDQRVRASAVLVGYWLERDQPAAEAYARSLPPGVLGDGASERVAQFLAAKDRDAAIAWAARIMDPARKEQALEFVRAEGAR